MKVLRLRLLVDPKRKRPLLDGYRAMMWFGGRNEEGLQVVHDAVVLFEDADRAEPGEEHLVRAWVPFADALPQDVRPGTEFRFLEPPREADLATVLDVLWDDLGGPLSDPAGAKLRSLRRSAPSELD